MATFLLAVLIGILPQKTEKPKKVLKGRGISTATVLLQSNAGQRLYDNWVRRTQGLRR